LAMCDQHGFVETSPKSLAHQARINMDDFATSIEVLESPDEESGSPEFEGRRVSKCEGGWLVLNYEKYRGKLLNSKENEQARDRMRKHRAKKAGESEQDSVTLRNLASAFASEFDILWSDYPNKKGKTKAKAKFIKARKDGIELDIIADGLTRYKSYVASQRKGGFADLKWQDGSTWFNEGWVDEYEVEAPAKPTTPHYDPDGSPRRFGDAK